MIVGRLPDDLVMELLCIVVPLTLGWESGHAEELCGAVLARTLGAEIN